MLKGEITLNIIGMDIGGTSIRIGITDEDARLYHFKKVPQKHVLTDDSLKGLRDFISGYLLEYAASQTIGALAAGIPATIDKARATVFNAPNVHGLNGKNIKAFLEEHFPFPVFIERDVSMLFYHDLHRFSIPHSGIIMACYVGTGVGNVISVDGRLLTGENGAAGELGHIPVWDNDEPCSCGNRGCAETLAGGKYLSELQRKVFTDTQVPLLFAKYAQRPELRRYISYLAALIATEINLLDPTVVILGGGVLSMKGFPRKQLEREIRDHSRKPFPERSLRFVYSDNSGENGVIGAGIYAMKMLEKENAP